MDHFQYFPFFFFLDAMLIFEPVCLSVCLFVSLNCLSLSQNCPVIITFRKEVTKIPDFPWIAAAAVSMVPIKIFALNPNKNKSYGPPSPQSEL